MIISNDEQGLIGTDHQCKVCGFCSSSVIDGLCNAHAVAASPSPVAVEPVASTDCCKGAAPAHECYISCGGTKPNPVPPTLFEEVEKHRKELIFENQKLRQDNAQLQYALEESERAYKNATGGRQ